MSRTTRGGNDLASASERRRLAEETIDALGDDEYGRTSRDGMTRIAARPR
jgi:hypothetical protein